MSTPHEREITIWAHYKSFNETYHTGKCINLDEISLCEEAWLTKVLRRISADSIVNRRHVSFIYSLTIAITLLRSTPHAWQLCQVQEESISPPIIRSIFETLERLLNESKYSNELKRQASGKFRSSILKSELNSSEKICAETVNYKTILGKLKSPAQNVLNMKDHLHSLDTASSLGAIPHKNYLDLIEKSANILQADLNKIINACTADLSNSKKNRLLIKDIESISLESSLKEKIGEILHKNTSTLTHSITRSHTPETIIAAYRQTINDQIKKSREYKNPKLHALTETLQKAGVELYQGYSCRQIFFSPERITTVELQAVFILLLCRTGWNRDSLIEMDRDGITSDEAGFAFVLQGFKTKTDDDTPPIYIEKSEATVIYSLELLIWNYNKLRQHGLINSNDRKLWYSWTTARPFDRSSTTVQMKPYNFIERHGLFDFSLKQIRSTVLSIDAYSSRSYETARQRGGHSSIGTTGRYLDHIITRSIASSINLQFQIDLEDKVKTNLESRKKAATQSLIRIGDGTTCSDAYSGLYSDRAADNICSAQNCHNNGGCPNRQIIINEESILDLIRTREYYFKHWQRLRSDNQEKFNLQTAPKIAFNDALYTFIKKSRFDHILNKIEAAFLCSRDRNQ